VTPNRRLEEEDENSNDKDGEILEGADRGDMMN
jgi:hypothetical protein